MSTVTIVGAKLPASVLENYPYIVVTCYNDFDDVDVGYNTYYLTASKTEFSHIPEELGEGNIYLVNKNIGFVGYLYEAKSESVVSDYVLDGEYSDYYGSVPIKWSNSSGAMTLNSTICWSNHDILTATNINSIEQNYGVITSYDGLVVGEEIYFNGSELYEERYTVSSNWISSIANEARRRAGGTVYTTDTMLNALQSAPIPTKTDWIYNSTWDYNTKTFTSNAKLIYASPPFSFIGTGCEILNLPNAVKIETVEGSWNGSDDYFSPFIECGYLTTINAPLLKYIDRQAFRRCIGLLELNLPSLTYVGHRSFTNCTSLTKVDFPLVETIGISAFYFCTNLSTLILRREDSIVTYCSDCLANTAIANGSGYIYVPSALVDTYKADEEWSAHTNQIRAIEDYPDICG